jgi:hypothetical protein
LEGIERLLTLQKEQEDTMKSRKSIVALLLLGAVAVAGLAGCGGNVVPADEQHNTEQPTEPPVITPPSNPQPAVLGKVTSINWVRNGRKVDLTWNTAENAVFYKVERYNGHPEVIAVVRTTYVTDNLPEEWAGQNVGYRVTPIAGDRTTEGEPSPLVQTSPYAQPGQEGLVTEMLVSVPEWEITDTGTQRVDGLAWFRRLSNGQDDWGFDASFTGGRSACWTEYRYRHRDNGLIAAPRGGGEDWCSTPVLTKFDLANKTFEGSQGIFTARPRQEQRQSQ